MPSIKELSARLASLEVDSKDQKRKGWAEIAAIPLTIAVTGIASTWMVTNAQLGSAERIAAVSVSNTSQTAKASLDAAERSAISQKQLKALELHIKYIADPDPRIRESGVKLLSVIEPELANRLRDQVVATEKSPLVRASAEQVRISGWFPVVSSKYVFDEAKQLAQKLNNQGSAYTAHVYKGTDDEGKTVFAVTLGGYLSRTDSQERVAYAKQKGIASDSFMLQHANWGQNLLQ